MHIKQLRRIKYYKALWRVVAVGIALLSVVAGPTLPVVATTGTVVLDFTEGPVGSVLGLTGSGFTPSDNYTVKFATTIIGDGTIDISGEFATLFTVPAYPRGQYLITVMISDNVCYASFSVTPMIVLDTPSGRPGSQVKVSGSGFKASSSVAILFDSTVIGSTTTNANGAFSNALITIPSSSAGKHTIAGRDSIGTSQGVTFTTMEPEISLSLNSGHVGDQISVTGLGFKPSTSISILFDSSSVGSIIASASGTFSNAVVTVPHSSKGQHTISARDSVSTSKGATFNTLEPEITLSQDSGRVDDQVSVSGLGFKPSTSISILFDSTGISSVTTDASGTFSGAMVTIPPASKGKHTISGKDTLNVSPGINFEITQSMTVSPVSGTVGDTVKINGSGFDKKAVIMVDFEGATLKTNIDADATGTFAGSFEIPEAAAGKHTVQIRDNSGNTDSFIVTVTQKLTISPQTGSPGTMAKVAGTGFGANEPVVIKYNGAPVVTSPQTIEASSQGSFYVVFEVPACYAGTYLVEASDASLSASVKFESIVAATISQLTSKSEPGHIGMQLSINGVGFTPNTKVKVTRATIQTPLADANTNAQGTFTVTFTIPPSPGGKHTIIVTDGVNTKQFDLFIEQEPPPVLPLLKPEKDEKAKQPVLFEWKDVLDVSGVTYRLQISRDEKFTSVLVEQDGLKESHFTMSSDELKSVTKDHPYFWRVKAVDGASNESEWSETSTFSVGFVFTLPNGEVELTLSALRIYLVSGFVILLVVFSFWLGRKTVPY